MTRQSLARFHNQIKYSLSKVYVGRPINQSNLREIGMTVHDELRTIEQPCNDLHVHIKSDDKDILVSVSGLQNPLRLLIQSV